MEEQNFWSAEAFAERLRPLLEAFAGATVERAKVDPGFCLLIQDKWCEFIAAVFNHPDVDVQDQFNADELQVLLIRAVCESFVEDCSQSAARGVWAVRSG